MITVRELIEVGGFDETAVLAGETFLEKELLGVTSFDSPDGHKWLRPGEFVLTTGFPFLTHKESSESGLIKLIDDLVEVGTPGLAIKLGRYIESLPPKVITHALNMQMPILSFPMEKAWSDVIVPVVRYMNDKQRMELVQTHVIYERFHRHLTSGDPVSNLIPLLHDVLQSPISIHVPTLKWNWDTPPAMREDETIVYVDKQVGQHAPQWMLNQPLARTANGLFVRWLLHDQKVQGAILLRQADRDLYAWEKVAIEQSAALLSLEMERQRTVSETYQRFRNDFLQLLVSGKYGSRHMLIRKAEEVGWELAEHYIAVVISVKPHASPDVETWKENLTLLETIRRILSMHDLYILFGLDQHNRILLLMPATENDDSTAKGILTDLITTLSLQWQHPVYLGVGRLHHSWEGIMQSYHEAQISFRSATHAIGLRNAPLFHMKDFNELGLERILFADKPGAEAHALAEEYLSKIAQYDKEKNGQLLHTLQIFLQVNGNYVEAANLLFVHKNTIKYRLQLIRELTGLHPENGQDQLMLRIAMTVHFFGYQA